MLLVVMVVLAGMISSKSDEVCNSSDTYDTICAFPLAINCISFGPQLTSQQMQICNILGIGAGLETYI
jgi:hypothetical protein